MVLINNLDHIVNDSRWNKHNHTVVLSEHVLLQLHEIKMLKNLISVCQSFDIFTPLKAPTSPCFMFIWFVLSNSVEIETKEIKMLKHEHFILFSIQMSVQGNVTAMNEEIKMYLWKTSWWYHLAGDKATSHHFLMSIISCDS